MFPNEVKQLSELDGCKAVWRELKLAMGVQGTTSTKLAKVTGDIELANVNIGDLEFLNGTTITGTISTFSLIPGPVADSISRFYIGIISFSRAAGLELPELGIR